MRPAKIVAIVIGALLVLIGLALIAPGGFLLWAYGTQRDSAGFFETSDRELSTSTYALTTPDVDANLGSVNGNWLPRNATAAVRIRATSRTNSPLFIAIGPTDQVSQYFSGVAHEEVTNFGWFSGGIDYSRINGGAPPSAPGQQAFWVVKQEGTGTQTLEWEVQDGNWTAVIMNANAASEVSATVNLGARFGIILPIGIGMLAGGVVLLAVGILLIVLGARKPRVTPVAYGPPGTWTPPPGPGQWAPPPSGQVPPPPGYVGYPPGPPAGSPGYAVPPSGESPHIVREPAPIRQEPASSSVPDVPPESQRISHEPAPGAPEDAETSGTSDRPVPPPAP